MSVGNHRWILSGGLASGKSRVRDLLDRHGVATIDADSVGHLVLQSDGPAFSDVAATWPEVVEDGEINRGALAAIVFNDPQQLTLLESMTHPHIFGIIKRDIEKIGSPVVVEIPLVDHGLGADWRRLIVDCHDEVRVERAVARGLEEPDVRARIDSQPPRSAWLAVADLVVPNHGSLGELGVAVERLIDSRSLNSPPVVSTPGLRDP
jgi:dephospho-CoA kinase